MLCLPCRLAFNKQRPPPWNQATLANNGQPVLHKHPLLRGNASLCAPTCPCRRLPSTASSAALYRDQDINGGAHPSGLAIIEYHQSHQPLYFCAAIGPQHRRASALTHSAHIQPGSCQHPFVLLAPMRTPVKWQIHRRFTRKAA